MIVTVYTKPGCQPCRATLRRIGTARPGVQLVILDAREHVELLAYWNMTSAPVVSVVPNEGETLPDGAVWTKWSGYRPDLIDATLPPLEPA